MEFDGLAAVRCWPVDVTIAGRQHRILARPAADWIVAILADTWSQIVPGLVDVDDDAITDRILAGDITPHDQVVAARDAIAVAAGVPWWVAIRLVNVAAAQASVIGEVTLRGVDAQSVSFAAWCAAVYQAVTRNADEKERDRFDRDLRELPEGVPAEELYDEDAAADRFEAFFATRGG